MSVISIRLGPTAPAGTWTDDRKPQVQTEEAA
jgi:hypothetical protein